MHVYVHTRAARFKITGWWWRGTPDRVAGQDFNTWMEEPKVANPLSRLRYTVWTSNGQFQFTRDRRWARGRLMTERNFYGITNKGGNFQLSNRNYGRRCECTKFYLDKTMLGEYFMLITRLTSLFPSYLWTTWTSIFQKPFTQVEVFVNAPTLTQRGSLLLFMQLVNISNCNSSGLFFPSPKCNPRKNWI